MKNKDEEAKRKDFCRTESVKKQKLQDHWLKGHYSATWFSLIIATVGCYNREVFSINSTAPTPNYSHPHGKEEIEQTFEVDQVG